MRRILGVILGLGLGLVMAPAAALAQSAASQGGVGNPWTDRWAVGVSVGTDGLGGDLKYSLSPQVVLRLRGTGLDFNHSVNSDGIHYSGKIKFATGGAFVDWHPFANGFLLSGGVVGGQREVDLNGAPTGSVSIDGHAYTAADIGAVYGKAKLPSAAGFLGLGYDSTFTRRSRIGFSVLAGVQLAGHADVTLTPTGLLAATPLLQGDVVSEENRIRHDLNFTQTYPAISAGLSYRF